MPSKVAAVAQTSAPSFIPLNLQVCFSKGLLLLSLYLAGHVQPFSGDMVDRVIDSEHRLPGEAREQDRGKAPYLGGKTRGVQSRKYSSFRKSVLEENP